MPDSGPRLLFANQLRGLAALAVLLAHYTVVAQTLRPAVAWVIAAPPLEGPVPAIARWVATSPADFGGTGVAVFFLISGFVIPFSLDRLGARRFLLARAWRILPTLWAALLLEGAAVAASGWYWGRQPAFGPADYLVNATLLGGWFGRGSVDWVSWTLSVEVLFYLAAAACRPWLTRHVLGLSLGWSVACLLLNTAGSHGLLPHDVAFEVTFLPHILLGAMFHARLTGRLTARGLCAGIAAVSAGFALCWWAGPSPDELLGRVTCLAAALALFAAAYALRHRFRPNRLLDAAAAISYPLYLIHCLLGFPVISFLMLGCGVPYPAAAITALALVTAVATLLHHAIELPTTRLGHALARRHPAPAIA